jgi:hypothetical protein
VLPARNSESPRFFVIEFDGASVTFLPDEEPLLLPDPGRTLPFGWGFPFAASPTRFRGPQRVDLGNSAALPNGVRAAYNDRMAARRINDPIEPMTLGNMRANGVRSLDVLSTQCQS